MEYWIVVEEYVDSCWNVSCNYFNFKTEKEARDFAFKSNEAWSFIKKHSSLDAHEFSVIKSELKFEEKEFVAPSEKMVERFKERYGD